MKHRKSNFEGLIFIEPKVYGDSRGWFYESWNKEFYKEIGIEDEFVQDNFSLSAKDVIRGLHYQKPYTQAKLVSVIKGEVWDVVVDLRKNSSTFGEWQAFSLTAKNKEQLYIPKGFAHGFCVLSESAIFHYKCTDKYAPDCERGIIWNDPILDIPWPTNSPIISEKDKVHPFFSDLSEDLLFSEEEL